MYCASELSKFNTCDGTDHTRACMHTCMEIKGGGDVYIQSFEKVFFPTIASN